MRSRFFVLSILALFVAATAIWWASRRSQPPAEGPPDLMPAGRWHRVSSEQRQIEQERAQLLSLGYLPGRFVAPNGSGIVAYDRDRAWPGVNLYTSGDGPEVRLMTLDGEVVHTWSRAYREVFPNGLETGETDYVRRARLLDGGDLVVLYQGGGVARLDAESRVVWATAEPAFNDLDVGGDGSLRVISKRPVRLGEVEGSPGDAGREVLEDSVVVISLADGAVTRRLSILRALAGSRFRNVLDPLSDRADILHGNTVRRLSAGVHEPFAPGQLLVSLREIDTLAVLDLDDERAVWAQRGPWRRQHEPTLQPGRRLLLFDNRGGPRGTSRVVEVDLETGETVWETTDLDSPEAGTVRRLPNGNVLITESERGRALEVTDEGESVWEFVSPHRAGPDGELIATLFELERYPIAGVWLETLVPAAGPSRPE